MTLATRKKNYTVVFSKRLPKELAAIERSGNRHIRNRIKLLIPELERDPFTNRPRVDIKPLSGMKKNTYRVRLGSYRLAYEIFESETTLILTTIFNREKGYKGVREPGENMYASNTEPLEYDEEDSDEAFYKRVLVEHRKEVERMKAGEFVRFEDLDKVMDELLEEDQK